MLPADVPAVSLPVSIPGQVAMPATPELLQTPATFVNPYFSRQYNIYSSPLDSSYPLWFFHHPNDLVVVTLAPTSRLLHTFPRPSVRSISFQVHPTPTVGKRKRGGTIVGGSQCLCVVDIGPPMPADAIAGDEEREDDDRDNIFQLSIPVGISGTLLEINSRLETDPDLLLRKPLEGGFLCVVMTGKPLAEEIDLGSASGRQVPERGRKWTFADLVAFYRLLPISTKTN